MELAGRGVIQAHAQLVIAVVSRAQRLDVHDHVAVPIGPGAQGIGGIAVVAGGADFLHLAQNLSQIVQILHLGVAQLLIEIPANGPVVEECIVLVVVVGDGVADTVESAVAVERTVGVQRVGEALGNIGAVSIEQVLLVPVEEQALVDGGDVIVSVAAPGNNVAQVAALHTGLVGAVGIGDNGQLNVEHVLEQHRAPAALGAGPVGQLAEHGQIDGFLVVNQGIVCGVGGAGRVGAASGGVGGSVAGGGGAAAAGEHPQNNDQAQGQAEQPHGSVFHLPLPFDITISNHPFTAPSIMPSSK